MRDSYESVGSAEGTSDQPERKRRRKSRWGGEETDKIIIPGMPAVLPTTLTKEQEEAYVLQLQIEEVSRKLRSGDLGIPANPEERSPSPEPIYSNDGKRMNTREYRTRKRLEEERHSLITRMIKVNPEFKPPADYKPPLTRVNDKVMIPQDEHPDINFVGLLIGPRGNTLKAMESETGAKIIIRGKGSVKEGKVGRKDGQPLPGENEPLHAYVTANSLECVHKAVNKIKEIIRQGVEVPEGQNDLRRNQLRQLALLNGTLRENDSTKCTNCGATDHKSWQCPDKPNVTMSVMCQICGGAGHLSKDCKDKKSGTVVTGFQDKSKIDEEYMSLMAELGEGRPPQPKDNDKSKSLGSATGRLFDPQSQPKALNAPPPTPLMTNNIPPPMWAPHGALPPPPPPPGVVPPTGMQPWPPLMGPPAFGVPPPPPPPSTNSSSSTSNSGPTTTGNSASSNSSGSQSLRTPPPLMTPPPWLQNPSMMQPPWLSSSFSSMSPVPAPVPSTMFPPNLPNSVLTTPPPPPPPPPSCN